MQTKDQELLNASLNGNIEQVISLLDNDKVDIDFHDSENNTSLLLALKQGHIELVMHLLAREANVHHKNAEGVTPLSCAIQGGHVEIIRWLLHKEVSRWLHKNYLGVKTEVSPSLRLAAAKGIYFIIKNMLKASVKIDAKDSLNRTALHWTAYKGRLDVIQWLLKEDRSLISVRAKHGSSALHMASARGYLPIVQWLLKEGGANITERSNDGTGALLYAAANGHLLLVQWLLKEGGAKITEKNHSDKTAILLAAEGGHLPVVQYLLKEGGSDITEKDDFGNTVLHLAAAYDHLSVVEWLIKEYRSLITKKNINGSLNVALQRSPNVAECLLANGAGIGAELKRNYDFSRINLQNQPFIGASMKGKPLTRNTRHFKEAITNTKELEVAMANGLSLDLVMLRNLTISLLSSDKENQELQKLCKLLTRGSAYSSLRGRCAFFVIDNRIDSKALPGDIKKILDSIVPAPTNI